MLNKKYVIKILYENEGIPEIIYQLKKAKGNSITYNLFPFWYKLHFPVLIFAFDEDQIHSWKMSSNDKYNFSNHTQYKHFFNDRANYL